MEMNQGRNRDKYEVENKTEINSLPSRAEYHRKKRSPKKDRPDNKKKMRLSIPLVLLLVLLMLPIGILSIINSGESSKAKPVSNSGEEVSFETEDSVVETESKPAEPEPEELKNEDEMESAKESDKKEKENNVDKGKEKKEEKKQEPAKGKVETSVVNDDQEKEQHEQNTEGKVAYHTVQQGETLFRIAMKYYNSQEGVEKIKQANGLGNNEISVGQTLKIPLP